MIIFGGITVVEQQELTKMPQEAATAWDAVKDLVGAKYKPVAYVGKQVVKGVNHVFLAEQTLITANPERHIVAVKINEFEGNHNILAIERIF